MARLRRDAMSRGALVVLALALGCTPAVAQTLTTIEPSPVGLTIGQAVALTGLDQYGRPVSDIKWSSNNSSVAMVDKTGKVTGQAAGQVAVVAQVKNFKVTTLITVTPSAPAPSSSTTLAATGIWISPAELSALPMSGAAWTNLASAAGAKCSTPNLSDQEDPANVCVLAKALVYARTGDLRLQLDVVDAIWAVVNAGVYNGRALALGRELAAYVIAADLIDLKTYDSSLDAIFRTTINTLTITPTNDGPDSLIACHERRPNNWGNHCGASRAAVAAYLGDTAQLARVAQVFKGYLGDRSSYAGFTYGALWWQLDPTRPVGINPKGATKDGYSVDGVLPDDQRRTLDSSGQPVGFIWPPPKESYVYEGLQGALVEAVILRRAGYDVFNWQDRALLRAFTWLHSQANFPAEGDDTWQPHLVNYFYGTSFPAPLPARSGKNMGWTDWTHRR